MEIIIGKTAGFCFGVSNAVNNAKQALIKQQDISCLGELVHNKDVTEELQKEGLEFINNIENAKKNVIIRAHGEPKETYEKARELKLKVIDLTCPKVIKIHNIAEEFKNSGYYIFLVGQKNHPETIGTISYCGDKSYIIENENDIADAINEFNNSKLESLLIISQTTFSIENFNNICKSIKENIKDNVNLEIKNTICNTTKLRQEETEKIAKTVDAMIVVGAKHSSNTNKLYLIAKMHCKNCFLLENEKELDIEYIKKYKKIGIMAGASTPKKSIETIVEKLKKV